jgi:sulfite reductase (NADPH) flavoprotein alpha-component
MTINPAIFTTPLTPEHARQLDELVTTLSHDEALWISGYLAGFARQAPLPVGLSSAASPPARLTILYGSETGHTAELAGRMAELAKAKGLAARAVDMAEFRAQELKNVRFLAVLSSTYGDGDPPGPAAGFYEFLHSRKAPRLEGTKFAVLGLGDSSYERFCQTAKDFDRRLEELGATRLHARTECDVDYENPAATWTAAVLEAFARSVGSTGALVSARASGSAGPIELAVPSRIDRQNPFPAPILETLVLNGRGSDKETRHIELSLTGSDLAFEPGDSLGVLPENDPQLVEELIDTLGLSPNERVADEAGEIPLANALASHYEITTLTPRFVEAYAATSQADKLSALLRPESRAELRAYMAGRHIIDVAAEFPVPGLAAKEFLAMLRRLPPRLYSLASSQAAFPDEAHLTVAVVRYQSHGRARRGVASAFLSERRGLDDTVPVYVERNRNFRLPADGKAPVIMVGAGTGVAPFRAFLQEREAVGSQGRNWLFFGDRRARTDFLYQTEWQRLLKSGRLNRMDVAFSRDQAEKDYVQHRLLEKGKEVYAWLAEGAHLYVCGDASHLAPDVHAALTEIVAREGAMSQERATDYVQTLQREKRYQRDVY